MISVLTIGYRYTQIVSVSLASVALTLAVKRTSVLWATVIGGKIFKDTNLVEKNNCSVVYSAWCNINFERLEEK